MKLNFFEVPQRIKEQLELHNVLSGYKFVSNFSTERLEIYTEVANALQGLTIYPVGYDVDGNVVDGAMALFVADDSATTFDEIVDKIKELS